MLRDFLEVTQIELADAVNLCSAVGLLRQPEDQVIMPDDGYTVCCHLHPTVKNIRLGVKCNTGVAAISLIEDPVAT